MITSNQIKPFIGVDVSFASFRLGFNGNGKLLSVDKKTFIVLSRDEDGEPSRTCIVNLDALDIFTVDEVEVQKAHLNNCLHKGDSMSILKDVKFDDSGKKKPDGFKAGIWICIILGLIFFWDGVVQVIMELFK